jgi:hypothetical protein
VRIAAIDTLLTLPNSPFHLAGDLNITNAPRDIAKHFDRFFRDESARFEVQAVYTEMNGFDINPDRWYCDLFAYESDGGLDDFDWLSDWQSDYFNDYTIKGLESLQAVYASDAFHDKGFNDAASIAGLVVVAKFQRFMQLAASTTNDLCVPLYATAHDYDYIARIFPGHNAENRRTNR